jgi:hypothetical protein
MIGPTVSGAAAAMANMANTRTKTITRTNLLDDEETIDNMGNSLKSNMVTL